MTATSFYRAAVLSGLACLLTPMNGPVVAAADTQMLTASIPATGLTHLDLNALDGTVDITTAADPNSMAIAVNVSLDPPRLHNFRRKPSATLSAVSLKTAVDKNVLRLGLNNAEVGNVETHWAIVVPARFSASINVHNGGATITGLAGGVQAAVGAGLGGKGGQLFVDVPQGRLQLDMGVGSVIAHRRSAAFDRADVSAGVGDAQLFLLGHEIKAPHAPGPGHRVRLDGDGPDAIRARVSVGDVALHIG